MINEPELLARLTSGNFVTTLHAFERMAERDVSAEDVRSVARTATECRWQDANASWRITGGPEGGERLVLVVRHHTTGLTLVTVHWEREKT